MADEVPNDVKEIENYVRQQAMALKELKPFKAALIHSQFEMIHPFSPAA
jgi:Fic family protein